MIVDCAFCSTRIEESKAADAWHNPYAVNGIEYFCRHCYLALNEESKK